MVDLWLTNFSLPDNVRMVLLLCPSLKAIITSFLHGESMVTRLPPHVVHCICASPQVILSMPILAHHLSSSKVYPSLHVLSMPEKKTLRMMTTELISNQNVVSYTWMRDMLHPGASVGRSENILTGNWKKGKTEAFIMAEGTVKNITWLSPLQNSCNLENILGQV